MSGEGTCPGDGQPDPDEICECRGLTMDTEEEVNLYLWDMKEYDSGDHHEGVCDPPPEDTQDESNHCGQGD